MMQKDKDAKKEAPKTPEVVKPSPPPVFPGLDPAAARQAKEFKHTSALLACRYEPSGKFLFTSGQDNTLQRWEIETAKKTDMAVGNSGARSAATRSLCCRILFINMINEYLTSRCG